MEILLIALVIYSLCLTIELRSIDYRNKQLEAENTALKAELKKTLITINTMDKELIWQTRDEMDVPTNPLQRLQETMCFTSRDVGEDKMIAFIYAIIVGWTDEAYKELRKTHNWSDRDIALQKEWHLNYKKAWNLYMENNG